MVLPPIEPLDAVVELGKQARSGGGVKASNSRYTGVYFGRGEYLNVCAEGTAKERTVLSAVPRGEERQRVPRQQQHDTNAP